LFFEFGRSIGAVVFGFGVVVGSTATALVAYEGGSRHCGVN
jgi:hypothetical protein